MSTILFFDQPEAAAAGGALVGGKGANLIVLTAADFAVPRGFVVTSQAYQQFLSSADWLREAVTELDYSRPDRLCEQCAEIRRRFVNSALPESVRYEIALAFKQMECGAFAVRSSSTFEDLAQAAFAGQHDTYLNVRGFEQILDRVRACFASLWEDRAVLYRHHQGFSQLQARMAVVVQQQIECDVAGVAFSIDPVGGRMDRMIIDANYGLGESVVSGEGEVDHFEIDEASLKIVARSIGHKEHQIVATDAGVQQRTVSTELANRACLSDEQIVGIATLLKQVQLHYGWPQDIEWGITAEGIHLLQSRPVTTIPPDWTRDESAERFPNPMTPLSWDFIGIAFRSSLTHSLDLMGLPPLKGDWFQIFDHYIYGNQNAVRLVAMFRPLRGRNVVELVEEIPALRHRFAWVTDLPVYWARDLDRYLVRLGRLEARAEPASLLEASEFVSDVLEAAQDYFLPNIAISMTQSGLHRLLHSLIAMVVGPEKVLPILDGLLAGCETKTAMVNREIHEMAILAANFPNLRDELLVHGGRAFFDANRLADYPVFAARFGRFLADHGHREVDMDYNVPTWSGQPSVVLDSLMLLLRTPSSQNPSETMRSQRVRYAQTEHQFFGTVPEELHFFFREIIRLTRTYTMLDDLEHYQTTRINPLAHRAALSVGRFLVDLGVLDEPGDVFFSNKVDLDSLTTGATAEVIALCREKAQANKVSYLLSREHAPAWSPGKVVAEIPRGKVLRGLPGSPGLATGKCFRIHGPEDFGRFPPKSVLVARTTNPAWTPLFYTAAAVITESGGPLSHGAVTAREMGLPAVMSVRGIMGLVADGQSVIVDGTNGVVELTS
jgi:rifampicin phosphotransferase